MSVGAIGAGSTSSLGLDAAAQSRGTQKLNDGGRDDGATIAAGTVAVQVSPLAAFLQQVTALQQTADPEKLKAALAQAAKELKLVAQQSPGPEAQLFSKLADRFAGAAKTGDLSQLQPEKPGTAAQPTGLAAYQSLNATDTAAALQGPGAAASQTSDFSERRSGNQSAAQSGTLASLLKILAELRAAVLPAANG
jgi:hypothetical protein